MKKLILFFLLCPLFLLAQNNTIVISGIIVDGDSLTPTSVSVNIYKNRVKIASSSSNKEGEFKIEIDTFLYNSEDLQLRFEKKGWGSSIMAINYDKHLRKLSARIYKNYNYVNSDLIIPYRISNKWGYVDLFNDTVSAPKYDLAFPMLENRGKVCINRKYGFVDWEGHEIIKIQYDSVSHFNVHKQAQVWKQNETWSININGEKVEPNRGIAFCGNRDMLHQTVIEKNGLFGVSYNYADTSYNSFIIPPIYKSLKDITGGTYIAQDSTGMYGVIAGNNKELTAFEYDSIQVQNRLKIFKNGKQGILSYRGSIMAHPIYDEVICVGKLVKAYKNEKLLGYIYKGVEYWED
jgi:hypothetical protein